MGRNKRLSAEERKKFIKEAAARVFVAKGFAHTTMEDLIRESGLSKGGFYHYYKSTTDVIYDMMLDGIAYRNTVIKSSLPLGKTAETDFIAEELTKKVSDTTILSSVYVEFLLAKKRNAKLEEIYGQLERITIDSFEAMDVNLPELKVPAERTEFLGFFINSMILGVNILSGSKTVHEHHDLIRTMFRMILLQ
ncbi:TetR/AcrR family transcriptional regulator [Fannyhessea vaginae]|jgi:hypothetical protein|uniref:TetR/AcrR family transcriptional regulator n=1 Tax=Fannyhessea vaginae TaxID=82135 RepID=UPI003A802F66